MPLPAPRPLTEDQVLRLGAGVAGVVLAASAALATELAIEHMRLLGIICGAESQPHCGWCYGAVGLGLAGLTAFAYALRPAAPRRAALKAS